MVTFLTLGSLVLGLIAWILPCIFGGEGLFLVKLTGPGKVILQTISIANLAGEIIPYVSNSK